MFFFENFEIFCEVYSVQWVKRAELSIIEVFLFSVKIEKLSDNMLIHKVDVLSIVLNDIIKKYDEKNLMEGLNGKIKMYIGHFPSHVQVEVILEEKEDLSNFFVGDQLEEFRDIEDLEFNDIEFTIMVIN